MKQDTILVIDLGGTENSVIARMIRSMNVYSEIVAHDITMEGLSAFPGLKGIVYAGGQNRMVDGKEVMADDAVLHSDYPSMAIGCPDMAGINVDLIDEGVMRHFVFDKCCCEATWNMSAFARDQIEEIKRQVGNEKVLLALSGGVDSSVVAALLIKAIGSNLTCIHVNHGLLRQGEPEEVLRVFGEELGANLIYVDAVDRFLGKLEGVSDPEEKRKIIGNEFIRVFEEESSKLKGIRFLAQGTIYPDIVESGTKTAKAIKAHHNVGGLPEDMQFELVEPVKYLYKDEVRECGTVLGLPDSMVYRQPFPGPGLGVRCLGAITRDRLEAVRASDAILREEFQLAGLEGRVWQYFTAVPDFKSVGVRNHARSFEYPVILRAVNTVDAMTAEIETPDWEILKKITSRIINEVPGVNRVVYDLTPKPTGTIEWE
ncbi:MAG TPA: glutamine-hydrolyzing GMP synthase [Clostridiaceae bacterium]|jgi:GMP synthase (glutamine-hydrolysing)|nr:glutamine-hydrolyzing GMP synthase [Clostridiaceae bacterium]